MKICMMHMTSHYVVMFFWTAVYVRTQDPPALNSSSVENNNNTDATPPLCLPIGDNPDPTCYTEDVLISSMINDTIPMPSSVVTESVLATIFSTTAFIPATLESNPAPITPTVHQSPNSPEDTKFITKTPTQSPMTVGKMVHKNQEDGWNATESTNCAFDPCVDLQDTCFNRPDPTCICPGVTSDSQPPDRPTSLSVTAVTYSVVLVKWCAPYSPLLEYLFVVRHEGLVQKNLSISSAVRQVFISELTADHIYQICVQAVNSAGSSGPKCASVWMGLNTEVYLYSLLAVCGVLMVIVATLSFCLYKQCKKTPVENSHLTRLISIPNPAFFNP